MNGGAAGNVGLAIASYDWIAAIALVIVAFFFLPGFLRSGIYTIPEYLEYRYNSTARAIMAFYLIVIYVGVSIAAVLYSGGLTIRTIFGMDLTKAVWLMGIIAAGYTAYGGLKAVIWSDLIQGSALMIGGAVVLVLGFAAVGGVGSFFENNSAKLHMILPADHPELPWTALILGIWIPNFYYWGLNQFIVQRTLAAGSLKQGQLGVLLAAAIQLILPLIIVIPGIMAFQLYGEQLSATTDAAFPLLVKNLVPVGLKGFMFAALLGAIMSSLDSMLNSASTIFTMDLYNRHWNKKASQKLLIGIGRSMTVVFVVIGCLIAPQLGNPKFRGIFHYMQDFQGYISPGIQVVFAFGLIFKRAPASAAVTCLLLNIPVYGVLHLKYFERVSFLDKMAITFIVLVFSMAAVTFFKPLSEPKTMPSRSAIDMEPTPWLRWFGGAIVIVAVAFYIIFW